MVRLMDAVGCLISTESMANERKKKMTILQEKSKSKDIMMNAFPYRGLL